MCCDTVYRGLAYADGHAVPAPGRHDAGGARRQVRRGEVERQERRSVEGRDQHRDRAAGEGQGHRRHLGRRVRRSRPRHGLQHRRWLAWPGGPIRPARTRKCSSTRRRPPRSASRSAANSSLDSWEGDQWQIGGGTDLGLVQLRSRARPLLLRHRQSRDLEPGAAARRQQVLDDDLRPRPRRRDGEVALPDDAARRVGLRRHQRDDPVRGRRRRRRSASCCGTRTGTASPTRSTARPASSWLPRSTIRR